jgi:ATP-binding cassette subfamily B protein
VFFLMLRAEGLEARVVAPTGERVMSMTEVAVAIDLLTATTEPGLQDAVADLPEVAGALHELFRTERVDGLPLNIVSYRRDGATSLWSQLTYSGGRRWVHWFALLSVLQLTVSAGATYTLGSAAANGLIDRGRVLGWAFVSLANVVLGYWSSRVVGSFTLLSRFSIKRRLLVGAFFATDRELREQGYGATAARLNEATVVEHTNLAQLFAVLTPVGMWIAVAIIFANTTLSVELLGLQAIATVALLVLTFALVRAFDQAYRERLALSEDLVDKIVGHRTRAIQEPSSRRHDGEDRALAVYAASLRRRDALSVLLSVSDRIFLTLFAALASYGFIVGTTVDELLLWCVGGFIGWQAIAGMSSIVEQGMVGVLAWRAIRPLFHAGTMRERPARVFDTEQTSTDLPTVVAVSSVTYSYRDGGRLVLRDANLRVGRGERVLIEGRSGGGKTTLVKLIAGELRPRSGSLLVGGVDVSTLGEGQWRKVVASAPQFHENHIFSDTFAFNLDPLHGYDGLGEEAHAICDELGLSELLEKMPAGGAQLVGETGWQLSHGERSRVFVARALLQGASVVIFDESFAALDPMTMTRVVESVRRRAQTLLVIAHV